MIKFRFCNFLLLLLKGISILGYVLCPATFMSFHGQQSTSTTHTGILRRLQRELSVEVAITEDRFGCSAFSGTEATFVIEGNVEEFVHHVRSLCQKVTQHRVLTDFQANSLQFPPGVRNSIQHCHSGCATAEKSRSLSQHVCRTTSYSGLIESCCMPYILKVSSDHYFLLPSVTRLLTLIA